MSVTRIQITTLNDDESATMISWEIDEEDTELYRAMLTDDLGDGEEAYYTTSGVEAIDNAVTPEDVVVW